MREATAAQAKAAKATAANVQSLHAAADAPRSPAKLEGHRLRKHADYQRVYKSGRKQFARQIAYFYAPRPADCITAAQGPRIGVTVPKAIGHAVERNRIKRRHREAIRKALPLLTAPVDLILHPRRSTLTIDFTVIEREVAQIFRTVQSVFDRGSADPARATPR